MPERLTSGTVSGLWPTPAARDCKGANSREHCEVTGSGRKHMDQLANAVAYPDLYFKESNTLSSVASASAATIHGVTSTASTMQTALALGQAKLTTKAWKWSKSTASNTHEFPTPTTGDANDARYSDSEKVKARFAHRDSPGLAITIAANEESGGSLNPTWAEWLMGWPLGWTDLKPLAMDKFRQWQRSHGDCCLNHKTKTGENVQ